jgi:hypothetical protein
MVKETVEEFAGQTFPSAERLVLWDETGEVFGVTKAEVEFDLYVHNGADYLVEVKSHLKLTDVLSFYQKVKFAEGKMRRSFIPLVIALSMDPKAEQQMRELGLVPLLSARANENRGFRKEQSHRYNSLD